ncbi:helix-turn-helix domain-containing protein [Alcanivorax sp.]|nr:MAG: hypothetical protein COA55_06535 [Alcanivorax sp.]
MPATAIRKSTKPTETARRLGMHRRTLARKLGKQQVK